MIALSSSTASSATADEERKVIRAGLIGFGLAGSVFHEPLIRACDRIELSAVLTSREHPLRVNSLGDLLSKAELVVIATPNHTHFQLAKAALERGRDVVVDKPFTVTLDEADELIHLAQERGRVLTAFHNRRWDGDFLSVEKVLPDLGEISLFEANWDRFRPSIKPGWRERGATHLCVNTMGAGLRSPQDHIDALRRVKDALGV